MGGDATGAADDVPANQEERRRADDLQVAFAADKEIVKVRAQWRGFRMQARRDAAKVSPFRGVDAAVST